MNGWNTFKVTRGEGIGRFVIEAEPQGGWTDAEDEAAFLRQLRSLPNVLAFLTGDTSEVRARLGLSEDREPSYVLDNSTDR